MIYSVQDVQSFHIRWFSLVRPYSKEGLVFLESSYASNNRAENAIISDCCRHHTNQNPRGTRKKNDVPLLFHASHFGSDLLLHFFVLFCFVLFFCLVLIRLNSLFARVRWCTLAPLGMRNELGSKTRWPESRLTWKCLNIVAFVCCMPAVFAGGAGWVLAHSPGEGKCSAQGTRGSGPGEA